MDHLSGADDLTPEGYAGMRRRELGWLRMWDARSLKDIALPENRKPIGFHK